MTKDMNKGLGQRIWQTRESRGLSREKLAELVNISPVFLACVEYGQKGVSLTTLSRLCETLQVSADFLLLGKCPPRAEKTEAQQLVESIDPAYQAVTAEFLRALIRTFAEVRKKSEPDQK